MTRFGLACLAIGLSIAGCTPSTEPPEGLGETQMPADVRAAYDLFAQRCSKCHSLSRPLQSGITDDGFWKEYVERMRRQPGSGISPADEEIILRFLHYYSLEAKREKGGDAG